MKNAFSTAVVLILLACLLVFIYIALLIKENHHLNYVAFSVSDASPITSTSISSEVIVKFTQVTRNTHDAYDSSTGRFVVPLDGTYLFMAQICSYITSTLQNSDLFFAITIGNIVRSDKHVTHTSANKTICARVVATEVVVAGEHAHVTVYSSNPNIVLDSEAANLFTGSRLHH